MTDRLGWDGPPPLCEDCRESLSDKAVEHGLEGFGHQGRCCACYDRRMGKAASSVLAST